MSSAVSGKYEGQPQADFVMEVVQESGILRNEGEKHLFFNEQSKYNGNKLRIFGWRL